jgi:hypothetical protein
MLAFRIEIWCDGDCCTRYLGTTTHIDPSRLPQLGTALIERARQEGWTLQGSLIWCPRCVRALRPEEVVTVAVSRDIRVGGGKDPETGCTPGEMRHGKGGQR